MLIACLFHVAFATFEDELVPDSQNEIQSAQFMSPMGMYPQMGGMGMMNSMPMSREKFPVDYSM